MLLQDFLAGGGDDEGGPTIGVQRICPDGLPLSGRKNAIHHAGANLYPPDGWRSDSDARPRPAGTIAQSFDCELPVFSQVAGQVDRGRLIPSFFHAGLERGGAGGSSRQEAARPD